MGKNQAPLFAGLTLDVTVQNSAANTATKFIGTDNPRYLRVLHSLELRARSREEIDKIAGASNGPQLVANLRGCGLTIPCHLVPGIDRDGNPIRFGVYSLDATDRRKILAWQRQRERKARKAADEK
jgi:hypothetical protein